VLEGFGQEGYEGNHIIDCTVFMCFLLTSLVSSQLVLSALLKNHTITELDLAGNDLKKSGGAAIGKILKTNRSITRLVLRSCGSCVLHSISNSSLKLNILSELGKDGVKGFCSALAINTTLKSLDIGWNAIGASGMEHLEKALSKNTVCISNVSHNSLHIELILCILHPDSCIARYTKQ